MATIKFVKILEQATTEDDFTGCLIWISKLGGEYSEGRFATPSFVLLVMAPSGSVTYGGRGESRM